MRVWFDCKGCGLRNAPADVPDRAPGQDIRDWMPQVQRAVAEEHRLFSPRCAATTCDLRIPLPEGSPQVGTPPEKPE